MPDGEVDACNASSSATSDGGGDKELENVIEKVNDVEPSGSGDDMEAEDINDSDSAWDTVLLIF